MTAAALACSSVGTSAVKVKEDAQEGTSILMAEVNMVAGTLEDTRLCSHSTITRI